MSNNDSTSSGSKKKKAAAAAVAVALAAALMIGGTFSYLQDDSVAVVNEFDGNSVYVEMSETGAEDDENTTDDDSLINDSFTIIPGTSQTKDPEVTVTTTVDAYVFLIVTDNTQDLVLYTIDKSTWTLIDSLTTENDDGSTTYVYYTEVDPNNNDEDGEQAFYALVSNTVYYSSSLTNEDMYETTTDEEGNETTTSTLKSNITLSFKSYAIQTEGFSSALAAYYAAVNEVPTATVTVNSNPGTISLVQSLTSSTSIGTITPDITFTFMADEDSSTAASSAYASWYADFYVTFDVSGVSETDLSNWNGYVAMAGQYTNYNATYWVPVIVSAYSSGSTNSYNLCREVLGTGSWLTYSTLVSTVGTFNCGTVKEVTESNTTGSVYTLAISAPYNGISVPDGVVMTVELRLYKETSGSTGYGDTYITVATYKYTY